MSCVVTKIICRAINLIVYTVLAMCSYYVINRCVIAARDGMTDIEFRRARHVISEIERTQKASELLQQGDYTGYGRLMNESHESLRYIHN